MSLGEEVRPARLRDPVVIIRAVPAAIAAAIATIEMIFFGQDHQPVFAEIKIDAFNQLFHWR